MFYAKHAKELTSYEKRLREFYWKLFLSEFSKILIFLIIFAFCGLLPEYAVALLAMLPLRNHGGGLHFKHYTSCLFVSFTFLAGSILLATYVIPPLPVVYISILLCALLGFYLVPVLSSSRPPATPEQRRKSKRDTVMIILLFFLFLCVCPQNIYFYICYWTVILHIFQLLIAYFKKRR